MPLSPDYVFPAADSVAASSVNNPATDTTMLFDTAHNNENSNMLEAINNATNNSGQALTYGMYLSRNKTISDIAKDMTQQNLQVDDGASDTFTRQSQINEWQAQNKLDTFFFLQCLFIYFTSIIPLIYLRRGGVIPSVPFYMLLGLLSFILIGILVNRAYYTANYRDKKFWNRRYISLADGGVIEKAKCNDQTDANTSNPIADWFAGTSWFDGS